MSRVTCIATRQLGFTREGVIVSVCEVGHLGDAAIGLYTTRSDPPRDHSGRGAPYPVWQRRRMESAVSHMLQSAGAVVILAPFRVLDTLSFPHILPNFAGSAVFALSALEGRQRGLV